MKKEKTNAKGITLIALVVTIIVLLILAGIALNLTIGQNGIFSKTQGAANTWRNAETNEQLALQEGADLIESYLEYNTAKTVAEAKSQNKFFKENTPIKDDLDNVVKVPQGFKIASDSATKVENGIVIEDKDGNQFVWIPAKTSDEGGETIKLSTGGTETIVYKRTSYTGENITTEYTETLPTDEQQSVNANGGYYIGRFEAGDKESTEAKTMRTLLSQRTNTVTIKKDQVPYNYVSQENCKTLAEGMSNAQGYKAKTKLVSSYAWDTAISLMQITNEDYGNNSPDGNYKDTTFKYKDISTVTDEEKTKSNGSSQLVPTGQTTAVCNIYDMGGNLWEYTTESGSNTVNSYTDRGGSSGSNYASAPSGRRGSNPGSADSDSGFRLTLYL